MNIVKVDVGALLGRHIVKCQIIRSAFTNMATIPSHCFCAISTIHFFARRSKQLNSGGTVKTEL